MKLPNNYQIEANKIMAPSLLILLAAQPSQFVGDNNIQLCCTLNNLLSLPGRYVVCYLSTVGPKITSRSK